MKALIKKEPKQGLWLEEAAIPVIDDHEVLVKVHCTSICGTDIHIYKWDEWAQKVIPIPMIIGHEFMGEIVDVGRNVFGLKTGEYISGEGHVTCGQCLKCKSGKRHLCLHIKGIGVNIPGCFSEYVKLPTENIFKISNSIPDEIAAVFDPLGNAMHTALSFNLAGEDLLITGAGPIGIMAAAIASKVGTRYIAITDRNPYRLALAKKMGATHAVNIETSSVQALMQEIDLKDGFTVGFEMSGHPQALSTLLEVMQPGAHVALLGILPEACAIDWDLVIFKMLTIKGIYGREIFETWYKVSHFLQSGLNINPVITHRFSYLAFEEGFQTMISGNCGKIILNWV